jgi:hypothetical protein
MVKTCRKEAEKLMSKYLKEFARKELAWTLVLTLVAIIFSGSALFLPWWSVNMSPEASSFLNSGMKTDYYLSQTVSSVMQVSDVTENQTGPESQTVPLSNLTQDQQNPAELSSTLTATYVIALVALAVSCIMLILIILQMRGRTLTRYLPLTGYVATLLLFITPILLGLGLPGDLSKLSRLTPLSLPATWTPITPANVTGFWGSIQIQGNPSFPQWASDGDFWVWGADVGWYLTFAASLLMAVSSLLARIITRKKIVVG